MALVDSVGFDLKQIKDPPNKSKSRIVLRYTGNIFLILFFSAVIFTTINFPAYFLIYRYRMNPQSVAHASPAPETPVKQLGDNTLIISKIGVSAPVNWDTSSADVMSVLTDRLAHLAGSSKPGEGKNVFITGHSSNYWWRDGSLNTVFALLSELKEGDEIILTHQGKIFRYKVSEIQEVTPKQTRDYFFSDEEKLTLMTCVPVGTNLHRLLVVAKPI